MEHKIRDFNEKLLHEIAECANRPICQNSLHLIREMEKTWLLTNMMLEELTSGRAIMSHTHEIPKHMTEEQAAEWNAHMVNQDGSAGGHWTIEQTSALAASLGVEFTHISPWCWNVTCNMMYSDYCSVAQTFGTDVPNWYGSMAKAFLFDPDGLPPKEKLAAFYNHVARPSWS